jgi:hypothetical protein
MSRSALRFIRQLRREAERQQASELRIVTASDFARGGSPSFAQVFDRDGMRLASFERRRDERLETFRDRARIATVTTLPGATRLVLGGLPELAEVGDLIPRSGSLPTFSVRPPSTAAHISQFEALRLAQTNRRLALLAGRRWGKSEVLIMIAINDLLAGRYVALFAPTYKLLSPVFAAIALALAPLPGVDVNRSQGEIRIRIGGQLDAWSLDHTGRSGRGRKYDRVLIDEAAFDEGRLIDTFPTAILPSILDRRGSIVVASTPNGLEGFFWQICNMPEHQFVVHHAPTRSNPHLPAEEIDALEKTMRPEIAAQELHAQFVDLSGASIFPLASLLDNGEPIDLESARLDYIGCTIDSGAGEADDARTMHDGTAALVWGLELPRDYSGDWSLARMTVIDWDIRSLALGHAADWMSEIAALCRHWVQVLHPRMAFHGVGIEKPAMGLRLIEIAEEQGLAPHALDTEWMEMGKDRRALAAEPHVTKSRVKFSRYAFDKRQEYRGVTRNHALAEITGFKTFDKKASRRQDDLFDCFTYAILQTLGDGTESQWTAIEQEMERRKILGR